MNTMLDEVIDEGYGDYIDGALLNENPYNYVVNPDLHDAWEEGWLLACNNEQ